MFILVKFFRECDDPAVHYLLLWICSACRQKGGGGPPGPGCPRNEPTKVSDQATAEEEAVEAAEAFVRALENQRKNANRQMYASSLYKYCTLIFLTPALNH